MPAQEKLLRPADFLIQYFGGLRPTARKIARSHASVNRWRKSKKEGGSDGFIPRIALHQILDLIKKNNWEITPMNLLIGGPAKEKS